MRVAVRRHGAAYTLIEVLAVVVLLGLVAGLAMPGLARRAAGDPLASAIGALVEEERRLRLMAIGQGGRLELDAAGFVWRGAASAAGAQETGHAVHLPAGYTTTWRQGDRTLRDLVIDREGCSADLELEVDHGGLTRRLRLAGLSGEWAAADASGAGR